MSASGKPSRLPVSARLGPYEITGALGRGGMGEVYRARDTRLDREVAIKLLPPKLAADAQFRARFEREARTISALNHPHICTLHDVGQASIGGEPFDYFVLELVEGESLAERIARGPLPLAEALACARQITLALDAAHRRGIVHRDLKPGNVMLTKTGAKLLDFGLARVDPRSDRPGDASTYALLTQPGEIMGTPAYMAPEQLRGAAADGRTDMWALGVVLYEMVAGSRPFEGATWPELSSSILTNPPKPLPPSVSPSLRALIEGCLQKEPVHRFQNCEQLGAVLDGLTTQPVSAPAAAPRVSPRTLVAALSMGILAVAAVLLFLKGTSELPEAPPPAVPASTEPTPASIVVLPLSPGPANAGEETAEAAHQVLIGDLSRVQWLRVVSRTSALASVALKKPARELAAILGVGHILEGSIRRTAGRLHADIRLVDARFQERVVFSRAYEEPVARASSLYSSVVADVLKAIDPDRAEKVNVGAKARETHPDAYENYLRGLHALNKMTPEGYKEGLQFFNTAIDRDPGSAEGYGGLAMAYSLIGHGPGDPKVDFPRAKAAADRALKLDPRNTDALEALAELSLYYDWDFAAADEQLRRVVEANPSHADAYAHTAWLRLRQGRRAEAHESITRARSLDPLNPTWQLWAASLLWWAGDIPSRADLVKARDLAREITETAADPPPLSWGILGITEAALGSKVQGIGDGMRLASSRAWKWKLGLIYAIAGEKAEAVKVAQEVAKDPLPIAVWGLAEIYGELGEKDAALDWLERAEKLRWSFMPWVRQAPSFRTLRGDHRFEAIAARVDRGGV